MKFSYNYCLYASLTAFFFSVNVYSHEIINAKGLQDLEFKALVQACNTTSTAQGLQALQDLTSPTSSINDIYNRQKLLQHFIEQEKEYQAINESIAAIASIEQHAAQYYHFSGNKDNSNTQKQSDNKDNSNTQKQYGCKKLYRLFSDVEFFYRSSTLTSLLPSLVQPMAQFNDSPLFLLCSYWTGMVGKVGLAILLPFITRKITGFISKTENAGLAADMQAQNIPQLQNQPKGFVRSIVQIFGINHLISKLNYVSMPETNTLAQKNELVRNAVTRQLILRNKYSTARDCFNARMTGWIRYATGDDIDDNNPYEQYIQNNPWKYYLGAIPSATCTLIESLTAAGTTVGMTYGVGNTAWKLIKNEHRLWEHIQILSQWSTHVRTLANQVQPYRKNWKVADSLLTTLDEPRMQKLFDSIQVFINSYGKDHRWRHDPGRVLHIHYCAKKAVASIQKAIRLVGEIDAWMSMVRAIKRYDFCPVTLMESPQAFVYARQLWSPVLAADKVVKNDIQLGKALLTGPNGGGKSTVMKSLAQATLLAQSWGFAPADMFVCTPFDCIIVTMDSPQCLQKNLSTFMAEIRALKQIVRKTQLSAQMNRHCLVVLDEPCRGTILAEATERISQLCENLNAYDNVSAILATHMYGPACKAEHLSSWRNYQLGYTFANGIAKQTFNLSPGIAHWWFNDKEKRKSLLRSLDDSFINQAE